MIDFLEKDIYQKEDHVVIEDMPEPLLEKEHWKFNLMNGMAIMALFIIMLVMGYFVLRGSGYGQDILAALSGIPP